MGSELSAKQAIEIRIGDVGLAAKLDALGAAIAAVREAHGDQMPRACWEQMHRAQESIAQAMMSVNQFPALEGHTMRRIAKPAITTNTTPVVAITTAGTGE